ncbi:UNVERIFIED_CONTAM: PHD finger protein 10 [Siphonaria sp. JEL0065]|nr:PHD finger protein 10 [Siphonaria sp. JEL0065]
MSGMGSDGEDRGMGDDKYRKGGASIKRPLESIGYYEPIYRAPPSLLSGLGYIAPAPTPSTSLSTTTQQQQPSADPNAMNIDPSQPPSTATAPPPPTTPPSASTTTTSDPRSIQNILRSAASAAEFNSRLRAQRRRTHFLDIHTNVVQVPQLTQPTHVLVEKQLGQQEKGMVLEVSFGDIKSKPASSELEDWMKVDGGGGGGVDSVKGGPEKGDAGLYPVCLQPGQYQGAYSLHRTRFEQNIAPIKSNESYFVDYTGKPLLAAENPLAGGSESGGTGGSQAPLQQQHQQGQQSQRPNFPAPPPQQQQQQQQPGRPMAPQPRVPPAVGTPTPGSNAPAAAAGGQGGSHEHFNQPGFIPAGMTAEQWAIMKPKLTYSQLKELREQAPVVSMGPSGKYSVRFTCGYLTRSGTYCQKPVLESGLICLFHQKMKAQEAALAADPTGQAAMMSVQNHQQSQQPGPMMNFGGMPNMMMMPGLGGSPGMMPMMGFQGMPNGGMMMPMTPQPMMFSPMMIGGAGGSGMPNFGGGGGSGQMMPASAPAKLQKQKTNNSGTGTPSAGGGGGGRKSNKAINLQDPECAICHSEEPPEDELDENPPTILLRCAECGLGHHLACSDMTTPVMVSKALAGGSKWKCGNCKMCEVCNKAGEDETLMVLCDACDKGYHTYCMVPKMDKAPSGSWHCPSCRICISCNNTDINMDWRHVSVPPTHEDIGSTGKIEIYACTYCVSCNKRFEAEQFCPLCFHVYNEEMEDIAMACCDVCDRWIHVGCDPDLTESRYKKLDSQNAKYTCVLCSTEAGKLQNLMAKADRANKATARPSKLMMYHGKYLVVPPLVKRAAEKGDA